MEPVFQPHPIPQNVTNFEFHLVGDMTLKQFAYLAAGVGFAFLIFTTLSTSQPLIAWPIIAISALLGMAFAFLPIQERPLDHWVSAFFKAIFKPTSLKFSSKIINPADPLFNRRLSHYLKTYKYVQAKEHAVLGNPNLLPTAMSTNQPGLPTPAKNPPDSPAGKKPNFIDKFKAGQTSFVPLNTATVAPPPPQPQTPLASKPLPTMAAPPQVQMQATIPIPPKPQQPQIIAKPEIPIPLPDLGITSISNFKSTTTPQTPAKPEVISTDSKDLKRTVELAKEAQATQQEIVKIEQSLIGIKQQAAQPGVDAKTYVENFEDLLSQLQKLNEKASKTAKELAEASKESPKIIVPQSEVVQAKSIPTLKLTSFPNVISGIVTDSQNNYIEGAIVVAHDKQGLPVRALKSNKLGQFVAATPLPNGEYSISVEKDNLAFDKVGLELNNTVLPPILVAAKKLVS